MLIFVILKMDRQKHCFMVKIPINVYTLVNSQIKTTINERKKYIIKHLSLFQPSLSHPVPPSSSPNSQTDPLTFLALYPRTTPTGRLPAVEFSPQMCVQSAGNSRTNILSRSLFLMLENVHSIRSEKF